MKPEGIIKRDLLYTRDHEWIDFQGSIAYIGVCKFKLLGIKEIKELIFSKTDGTMELGSLVATIISKGYRIPMHMPITGKIIRTNELLLEVPAALMHFAETSAWIALVAPSIPYQRNGLLSPEEYKAFTRNKKI